MNVATDAPEGQSASISFEGYCMHIVGQAFLKHELEVYSPVSHQESPCLIDENEDAAVDALSADMLVRLGDGRHMEIQVEGVLGLKRIEMRRPVTSTADSRWIALVVMLKGSHEIFLVHAKTWARSDGPFRERSFEVEGGGQESGVEISQATLRWLRKNAAMADVVGMWKGGGASD